MKWNDKVVNEEGQSLHHAAGGGKTAHIFNWNGQPPSTDSTLRGTEWNLYSSDGEHLAEGRSGSVRGAKRAVGRAAGLQLGRLTLILFIIVVLALSIFAHLHEIGFIG